MGRRHHSKLPKLNRDSNSRKSLFRVQLKDLIKYGYITTTVTKAKILKRHFDKLMTKAQAGTLPTRRKVISELGSAKSANRLVDFIAPNMKDRTSGFTSIEKVSVRRGDSTAMATIKLVTPLPAEEEKKAVVKKDKAVKEVAKKDKKVTKKESK